VRLFKRRSPDLTMTEISARMRGFLLDSQINNAHDISLILGCATQSTELAEKEEEESDKRIDRISHLVPILYAQAQALSQGTVEYQRANLPDSTMKIPDSIWWDSRKLLEQVSVAALLGAISQLVDMGLLELPKRHR
jgi:hypothetical protein